MERQKSNKSAGNQTGKKNAGISEPIFFFGLFVAGAIFVYVWLAKFGNDLETYTDIVWEYTSIWNSNKSGERTMGYALAILGACAIVIYYFIRTWKGKIASLVKSEDGDERRLIKFAMLALVITGMTGFFVYSKKSAFLFTVLAVMILFYVLNKRIALSGIVFFISSLYAIAGVYRALVLLGGVNDHLSISVIAVISLGISLVLFFTSTYRKTNLFIKAFLIIQILIPFTLLIFLASQYKVGETIQTLHVTKRISCVIWGILIWFVVLAVKGLRKNWNELGLESAISFGTLVCIMNFNNYSGTGQIISGDLHHPFENIIGFSQTFELGQKLFSEYIPVSGMYSLVHGFFLWLFGNNYYAYYYVTENLFYLTAVLLIVFLLRRQMRNYGILLTALFIPIIRYNRVTLIIPIMLLLAWPKLIKNKNLWLKGWMLTSLANGLYYPVFGAAVCLGFLPMGIYQIVTYGKSDFRTDVKNKKFWLGWAVSIVPVLLCIPLLLGTLRHMLAMAGQTLYADGIARFGQTLPDTFFSCIPFPGLRLALYDICTFLAQAAIVWISAFLAVRIGGLRLKNRRMRWNNPEAAALSASFGIMMLVSFSYTLVRIDIDSMFARSRGVIYGAAVMMIVLAARYLKKKKAAYAIVGIVVFLVAAAYEEPILYFDQESRLDPYYTVAEGYVLTEDEHIPRLGQCYVQQSVYDNIIQIYDKTRLLDSSKGYLGIGNFGHFYLSSIKGDSVMENGTIKGYDAAQETAALMKENGTISTAVDSFNQYYLFHWLLTSGEYVWDEEAELFHPNDEGFSIEEIQKIHKDASLTIEDRELGRTPSSWGSSRESLDGIFIQPAIEATLTNAEKYSEITFRSINGDEADFLYLEFAGMEQNYTYILFDHQGDTIQEIPSWFSRQLMKKDYNRGMSVIVSWADDEGTRHSMNCNMGRGKLLIPLGSGTGWLLNRHDSITVTVKQGEDSIQIPDITKAELLKVREVK